MKLYTPRKNFLFLCFAYQKKIGENKKAQWVTIILAIILASMHQLHLNSSGRVSCPVRNPDFRTIVMLVCLLSQSRAPPEKGIELVKSYLDT